MSSNCAAQGCCSPKSEQHDSSSTTPDEISELCSGRVCDEECIKAAAVMQCNATCNGHLQHEPQEESDHCRGSWPSSVACASHLRAAFETYSSLLAQTKCICRRVLEEQYLDCRSATTSVKTCSSRTLNEARPRQDALRQRRNLPCFDKRAVLRTSAASSTCGIPVKQSCCVKAAGYESSPIHNTTVSTGRKSPCGTAPSTDVTRGRCLDRCDGKQSSCCKEAPMSETCTQTPDDCVFNAAAATPQAAKSDAVAPTDSLSFKMPAVHAEPQETSLDPEKGTEIEHVVFGVSGMECTGCEGIVHKALAKLPGVSRVQVVFVTAIASCSIDTTMTTVDEIIRVMQRTTKYKLWRFEDKDQYLDISTTILPEGMNLVRGVCSVKRINKTTVRVGYDATIIGARDLLASFPGACLAPPSQDQVLSAGIKHLRKMLACTTLAAALTIPVLVLAWGSTAVSERDKMIVDLVLATLVQAIAVPIFYSPALSALVTSHIIEMDMLVVISITAAYGYSLVAFAILMRGMTLETGPIFETSSLLITLVLLGRLVAAYSRRRAMASVSLRSLQPAMANLVDTHGETELLDARLLEMSDTIMVPSSSQIVTDGTVITGDSEVDESLITGESLPVRKSVGDDVIAGTMNGTGILHVKVTRLPGRNTIADIAKLVEEAHRQKSRVQDLADVVSSYFVPLVVVISVVVTAIWLAINFAIRNEYVGVAIGRAITYGIAVLAISCPCALGLAVPMVLVVSGGKAAKAGVIIKTANVVERGYRTTDVVFDKTGTLTEPTLTVIEEVFLEQAPYSRRTIIGLVKSMTRDNGHPVSKAVSRYLENEPHAEVQVGEIKVIPGSGVSGVSAGHSIAAGSVEMAGASEHPEVKVLVAQGFTIFCVASNTQLLAIFGLRTTTRSEAKAVVNDLSRRHIRVHILSGDTQQAVDSLAHELNIPTARALGRRSPRQKRDYVANLMTQKKTVLFCGDGTNDAVAVAQAHVGVQIAPGASDITSVTADVILLSDDLAGILQLLDISKAAYLRICFNFLWAGLYNMFAILLASGAFVRFRVEPAFAGLGEIISVVPVVLTALTIRQPKKISMA